MKPLRRRHAVSFCLHCTRAFLHRADKRPRPQYCGEGCARLAWVNRHADDEVPEPDQHPIEERLRDGFARLHQEAPE